ncbi:SDR family NAD(P)-dependent oxidoreductase [Aurantimonas sp. C2-5-R2]|uniref:SDR family NAD(P)-dependent oxidoreductase n=1 Tax=Aurantimonas sp. C2-5-R2 TaxID=3113713 RepID=UPI003FA5CF20
MSALPRILLITDSSRGIGAETAIRAAERGYWIALNYSSDDDGARKTEETIRESGGKVAAVPADIADPRAVTRLFATGMSRSLLKL